MKVGHLRAACTAVSGFTIAAVVALGAFLFASVPIAVGMIAADLLPGIGGVNDDIPLLALLVAPVGPLVVMIAVAPRIERAVERLGLPARSSRTVAALGSLLLLAICLRPFMTGYLVASVAALIATAGYKAAAPLVARLPG